MLEWREETLSSGPFPRQISQPKRPSFFGKRPKVDPVVFNKTSCRRFPEKAPLLEELSSNPCHHGEFCEVKASI